MPSLLTMPELDLREHEPLASMTRYRLGGSARYMARPADRSRLAELIAHCRQQDMALRVLGGGANVLIDDDGVDGVVVRLDAPAFTKIDWNVAADSSPQRPDALVRVRTGAGVDMARLALEAVRRGLSGLECMAGIPGSVGGIVRMNAGGKWGDISEVVDSVTVIDTAGRLRQLARDEIGFAYRHTDLDRMIVCDATFTLTPGDPKEIQKRYRAIWAEKNAHQPLGAHCAGCVFKNPPGDSAGRLIDQTGLKDLRVGRARVSPEHANFIVADEGGTARDVLALIEIVRQRVAERWGVKLELEVQVWDQHGQGRLI